MTAPTNALRVCVVSALYHPSLGGLGKQSQLLTERLSREGVSLFVIARRMKNMPPAVFSEEVRVYRTWSIRPRIHNFQDVTFMNLLTSLSFAVTCAFLLFRKRHEYDIAHFHGASIPLIINLPLLKLLGKKVIAKVASANLGIEPGSLQGRYLGLGSLLARLLRRVDRYIATTSEIEGGLLRDGVSAERIARIPNFIDFTAFSPCSADRKDELKSRMGLGKSPVVAFTGRFIQDKGISYLLDAWTQVIRVVPDARLVLLGDGPVLPEMKKSAERLGIGGSVGFPGHTNAVIDYLHAADVYAFPSLQEGMPNALLEAMACGLPAVATRIGGVTDIIEHERNGLLVDPRDARGLAEGIVQLLTDRNRTGRIAAAAFQRIKSSYSLDSVIPRYIGLYQDLVR